MSCFYRLVRICSQSFTLQAAISHYSNHYEVWDIVFCECLGCPMKHTEGYRQNRKKWQPDYHLKYKTIYLFFNKAIQIGRKILNLLFCE